MPKMDDNELGSVIRSEIQQAQNYFETEFADARMKAAVDSLVPTHDYHSYSTN